MIFIKIYNSLLTLNLRLELEKILIMVKKLFLYSLILGGALIGIYQAYAAETPDIDTLTCAEALGFGREVENLRFAIYMHSRIRSAEASERVIEGYENLLQRAQNIPFSPLHRAAYRGKIASINRLVEVDKIPVDIRGELGKPPLSEAASMGRVYAIRRFLDLGADVNAPDVVGRTPLSYAAIFRQVNAIHTLLDGGADIDRPAISGMSPIMEAIKHGNLRAFRALRLRGASLRMWVGSMTALHIAVIYRETRSRPRIIGIILDEEPTLIGEKDLDTQATALHWAAFNGYTDAIAMLLERGALPAEVNADGETPLHVAARVDQVEAFLMLKESYPSLMEAVDEHGRTPSQTANHYNSQKVKMVIKLKLNFYPSGLLQSGYAF